MQQLIRPIRKLLLLATIIGTSAALQGCIEDIELDDNADPADNPLFAGQESSVAPNFEDCNWSARRLYGDRWSFRLQNDAAGVECLATNSERFAQNANFCAAAGSAAIGVGSFGIPVVAAAGLAAVIECGQATAAYQHFAAKLRQQASRCGGDVEVVVTGGPPSQGEVSIVTYERLRCASGPDPLEEYMGFGFNVKQACPNGVDSSSGECNPGGAICDISTHTTVLYNDKHGRKRLNTSGRGVTTKVEFDYTAQAINVGKAYYHNSCSGVSSIALYNYPSNGTFDGIKIL